MSWAVVGVALGLIGVFVVGWLSNRSPPGPVGPTKAELDLQASYDAKRRAEIARIDSLDKGGVLADLNRRDPPG